MLIAQITDTHLTEHGGLAQGVVNTLPKVQSVVDSINGLPISPDVVLFTGDLADNCHPDAYQELSRLRSELNQPSFVIPGNHDDRILMREAFPELPGQGNDPIQYVIDGFPVRIVALDTLLLGGNDNGDLCDDRLDWLEDCLAQQPDVPTLIMMHHPPFRTYIDEMDFYGIQSGVPRFEALLMKNPQVNRIICGHVHRSIQSVFANRICSIAPAVSFDQAFGFGAEGPTGFSFGSPRYELHKFNGTNFVSHTMTRDDLTVPIPYPVSSYHA